MSFVNCYLRNVTKRQAFASHWIQRLVCLSVLVHGLVSGFAVAEPVKDIHLAATDWCPYTCADTTGQKGIVTDYLTAILAAHDITLHMDVYPWSRAISLAEQGKNVDGLLTVVPGEAPGLATTKTPTMTYQDCFFTRPDDSWQYENTGSLAGHNRVLGIIAGYGYSDDVMAYLNNPASRQNVYVMSGEDALWRLMQQLHAGRIDILIDDPNIINWTRRQYQPHPAAATIRKANCQPPQPFYIALHPEKPWARDVLRLLDTALADKNNQDMLNTIIAGYFGKIR